MRGLMDAMTTRSWKDDFQRSAAIRHDLALRLREMAVERDREREKKREAEEDRMEREFADAMLGVVLATNRQLVDFSAKLDRYDAVTVEALMDNSKRLDAVRVRIDDMLVRAYELPDGRKVFKTVDGQRVFDANGVEIGHETLDPAMIDDSKPRWESYKAAIDERNELNDERGKLIEFQDRVDEARERLDRDGVTTDDLDALDAELNEAMPDAVRKRVSELTADRDASADRQTSGPAAEFDLSDNIVSSPMKLTM